MDWSWLMHMSSDKRHHTGAAPHSPPAALRIIIPSSPPPSFHLRPQRDDSAVSGVSFLSFASSGSVEDEEGEGEAGMLQFSRFNTPLIASEEEEEEQGDVVVGVVVEAKHEQEKAVEESVVMSLLPLPGLQPYFHRQLLLQPQGAQHDDAASLLLGFTPMHKASGPALRLRGAGPPSPYLLPTTADIPPYKTAAEQQQPQQAGWPRPFWEQPQ